jgi:hypothetical protein
MKRTEKFTSDSKSYIAIMECGGLYEVNSVEVRRLYLFGIFSKSIAKESITFATAKAYTSPKWVADLAGIKY